MARAEAYLRAKFRLDPSNRFATIRQRYRPTDRTGQRSDSVGRTVLQTVCPKTACLLNRRCYYIPHDGTHKMCEILVSHMRSSIHFNLYIRVSRAPSAKGSTAMIDSIYEVKPNSITLSGRRQVLSWSQACSELEFGLSSSSLSVLMCC